MKTIHIAALATLGWLTLGPAQAGALATHQAGAASPSAALVEQAQYRDWRGPGWRGRGWGPGGRPRVVCRVVPRRYVDRFGRVRIVQQEVCRRRGW